MTTIEMAAILAVREASKIMSECQGDELEVLTAFSDAFQSEIDGWDMRICEIKEEE